MRSTKKPAPSQKIRSTSELAKALNLSRWTVSRVLNGHPGVHPDTVAKVQAAMQAYGFAPNPHAQGLRRGRVNRVGVCVPDADLLFLSKKLEHLRQTLDAAGVPLVVGLTDGSNEKEIETLNHFRASRVAAVALFASQLSEDHPAITQFGNTPVINIDPIAPLLRPKTAGSILSLRIDRSSGMKEAMAHLYELGHRHFATLGIDGEASYTRVRLEAIIGFLKSKNLPPETHLHRYPLPAEENYYRVGHQCATYFPSPATAILAVNDRVAIGLIDGLRHRGITVPEQYSIIGYDNMEVSEFIQPALTSIDAKPNQLAAQAASLLLAAMRNEPDLPQVHDIPTKLVIRASTGCARQP